MSKLEFIYKGEPKSIEISDELKEIIEEELSKFIDGLKIIMNTFGGTACKLTQFETKDDDYKYVYMQLLCNMYGRFNKSHEELTALLNCYGDAKSVIKAYNENE